VSVVAMVVGCAMGARGVRANLVADGSFETPVQPANAETSFPGGSTMGAWNVLGNDVLLIQAPGFEVGSAGITFNAFDGIQCCDVTGSGNTGPTDGVSQTISTVSGGTYHLSFYLGTALSNNGTSVYQTPARVEVRINSGAAVGFSNTQTTSGFVNWQPFSMNFTATGSTTTITFLNGETTNSFAGIDLVDVEAVPEPGTLAVVGMGFAAVLWRRRRGGAVG
jgi:hypothetical protein